MPSPISPPISKASVAGSGTGRESVPYASCCSPSELMSASAPHCVPLLAAASARKLLTSFTTSVEAPVYDIVVGYSSAQIAIWMADPMAFAAVWPARVQQRIAEIHQVADLVDQRLVGVPLAPSEQADGCGELSARNRRQPALRQRHERVIGISAGDIDVVCEVDAPGQHVIGRPPMGVICTACGPIG